MSGVSISRTRIPTTEVTAPSLTPDSPDLEGACVQLAAHELEARHVRRFYRYLHCNQINCSFSNQTEPLNHFRNNVKIMKHFYEWPKSTQEFNIFFREVFKLPEFWPELWKKTSFALVQAMGDVGLKLAIWQFIYGGTHSPQDYVDHNTYKNFVTAQAAAIPVCWTAVPFENARRAYYADRSWPVELRRGYTSGINALLRIPFEEGPYYLIKGGWPICMHAYLYWSMFYMVFSWIKNKFHWLWTY